MRLNRSRCRFVQHADQALQNYSINYRNVLCVIRKERERKKTSDRWFMCMPDSLKSLLLLLLLLVVTLSFLSVSCCLFALAHALFRHKNIFRLSWLFVNFVFRHNFVCLLFCIYFIHLLDEGSSIPTSLFFFFTIIISEYNYNYLYTIRIFLRNFFSVVRFSRIFVFRQ